MQFSSLLVANRGEIAVRIFRTAKAMGLRTIAVYSDADADAQHVQAGDIAVHIGASSASESYLNPQRIIDAAREAGADAIHPGYGFLSENADFARAVTDAGLVFVGPSADAIEVMGDKARSKRAMIEAGVPCVPGYQGEDQSNKTLIKESEHIGFPLMVKAAAGGGGRGMRLVVSREDLEPALEAARQEAKSAFGSDELIVEKAIQNSRHVEVQVFGDRHGTIVHLGERDCSVQRRHQKVVEESPCPVMTPKLREQMGAAAIDAARAVDYVGAGTVEFLLDEDGQFYFLEMNTRLQVEHPVTEMVTGLDLVAMQLRVAAGELLNLVQSDIELSGHAIEVRLYAEDPENDFLPSTGKLHFWNVPKGGDIRVDSGVAEGDEISPFYDPMIAKVIAHGATRDEARRKLVSNLQKLAAIGPKTNRDFLLSVLAQQEFVDGKATTAFLEKTYGDDGYSAPEFTREMQAVAGVLKAELEKQRALELSNSVSEELHNWSSAGQLQSVCDFLAGDEFLSMKINDYGNGRFEVGLGEETLAVALSSLTADVAKMRVGKDHCEVRYCAIGDGELCLAFDNLQIVLSDPQSAAHHDNNASSGRVVAPMHGALLSVDVAVGDTVAAGDRLAVLEAMKMQHEITAQIAGTVSAVHQHAGAQVAGDDVLIEIDVAEEETS